MSVAPVIVFDETSGLLHADVRRPTCASFSMLDQWRACPGRWVGDRLLPKPREWNDPLTLGSLAHAALELACGTPDVDAPDWLALCERAPRVERERNRVRGWGSDPIPDGVVKPDGRPAVEEDWVRAAAGKLSGFRLSDALGRRLTPVTLEEPVEGMLDGVPLRGAVDYRDADGTVVDWKTGRVPAFPSGRERHADQLRVYRMLLNANDVEVRSARDVYVESRAWADADLSDKACDSTLEWMRVAWNGIVKATGDDGSGAFPLRPSGLCGWCPLALACPAALIRGVKAHDAAANSVHADDPRIGFRRTHAVDDSNTVRKERGMVDLLELISTPDAGESDSVAKRASIPGPARVDTRVNDPWLGERGRRAMEKWGVTEPSPADQATGSRDETDPWAVTVPQAGDPWNQPKEKPVEPAVGESKPDKGIAPPASDDDPWAQPVTGTADVPAASSSSSTVLLTERKPYDPTIGSDGRVNTAGYGFTQYMMTCAYAGVLADGHKDRIIPIRDLLLNTEWRMARDAFGMIVPDIPGLESGRPQRDALFTWLDSTLARDADRVLRMLMDANPVDRDGVSDAFDATVDRIRECGRMGGGVLRLVADRLRA